MGLSFLTIRARLTLAAAVIIILAMSILAFSNIRSATKTAKQLVAENSVALINSSQSNIETWVNQKVSILNAAKPSIWTSQALHHQQQAIDAGEFKDVYAGFANGRMITQQADNLPEDYDPRSRPWYTDAQDAQALIFTAPYIDATSKELIVTAAEPASHGTNKAVVAADIDLNDVIHIVDSLKPSKNSFAYLVTNSGKIITHPDESLTLKDASEAFANADMTKLRALAENTGQQLAVHKGQNDYWLMSRPIDKTGWILVIAQSQQDALANIYSMTKQAIIGSLVMIVVAVLIISILTRILLSRLIQLRDAFNDIAKGEGDLTQRLPETGHDELSQVASAFNLFISKIANTLIDVRNTTTAVNQSSNHVSDNSNELASRTDEAAASIQETSSSVEEIASTAKNTASSGIEAADIAQETSQSAQSGGQLVRNLIKTMESINNNASRITDIIGVIDSIAFQTNILALNASVEAARAGEHGAGFAVVASEVRKLAQRSAQSADEIRQLIETNANETSKGSHQASEAFNSIEKIEGEVARVTHIVKEISQATEEESLGISQIEQAIQQMDIVTQSNATQVQELATTADNLRQQAHQLYSAIAAFKLDDDDKALEQPAGEDDAIAN